jgi:hypothetical protein
VGVQRRGERQRKMNSLTSFISQYSAYLQATILSSIGLVFFLSVIKKDNFKKDSKKVVTCFLLAQLISVVLYLIIKRILGIIQIFPGEDADIILFIFLNLLCIYIETAVFYKLNDRSVYSSKNKEDFSKEYRKVIFSSVRDFCLFFILILIPLYVFGNGSMNNFILFISLAILIVFFTHTVLLPTVLKKFSESFK